ncbi:hypothetical protein JG687_00019273, partial [Phytophthora cactorum]
ATTPVIHSWWPSSASFRPIFKSWKTVCKESREVWRRSRSFCKARSPWHKNVQWKILLLLMTWLTELVGLTDACCAL